MSELKDLQKKLSDAINKERPDLYIENIKNQIENLKQNQENKSLYYSFKSKKSKKSKSKKSKSKKSKSKSKKSKTKKSKN